MEELAIDAVGKPGVGEELSTVGVARELERDASFFGDGRAIGCVTDEDAGAGFVDVEFCEDRAEVVIVGGVEIRDADELQAVEIDIFLVEDADAGAGDGGEKFAGIADGFVVSGGEVGTEFGAEIAERERDLVRVDGGAVE